MKFKLKLPAPIAIAVIAAFSLFPSHAQAQWAVFDGASYVELGTIWSENVSTNVKLAQTVVQGGTLISQGLQVYNLALRETTALRNKQWMQAAGYLSHLNIPGQPNWTIALRSGGGVLMAAGAWQQMTAPGTSMQNRIQIADAFGTSMMDALGGCNASAIQNDGAIGQLEQIALSMNTLDNTRAALGGMSSMGNTQMLRIQECQHNIQQQQAQAQMLQLMRQRDYDNAQNTIYQHIDAVVTSNPRGITNLSGLMLADFN
jgi:hypothetical protein